MSIVELAEYKVVNVLKGIYILV